MDTDQHRPPDRGRPRARHDPVGLDEAMLAADPVASSPRGSPTRPRPGLPEPNAMVLSTVSAAGRPRARTVLLKEHGPAGFVFYTNRTSRKGPGPGRAPRACRAVPLVRAAAPGDRPGRGDPRMSQAESEPYFHSRRARLPARRLGEQAVVGASRSRAVLDDAYARLEQRWPEGTTVPMPDFWGGYRLAPESGRILAGPGQPAARPAALPPSTDARWVVERLAP